ncbi:MAG: GGDEF domain-containing protein [Magnetococcales bacterium]|nr:GGDEF domain-containing protein [Magnetococcales bacterium]
MLTDEQIASIRLFKGVPAPRIRSALQGSDIRHLEPGEVLLAPAMANDTLYLLLDGQLSIHLASPTDVEIRVIEPGGSVGELSIIQNSPPSAFVVAKTSCRVLCVAEDQMWELVDNARGVARNLLSLVADWLRANTWQMAQDRGRMQDLEKVAWLDGLTGLFNRRWLDQALRRKLANAQEDGNPLTFVLLDVDHFKKYNDTQGHQGGDQALIALAQTLSGNMRPNDFAARYGGEEFALLLPNTHRDAGLEVADRLREVVSQREIAMPDGRPLPGVTVSMGLAVSGPDSTPGTLAEAADARLYEAKKSGRNRVCG